MTKFALPFASACLALLGAPIGGAPAMAEGLPRTLTCEFTAGATTSFETGKFTTTEAKPLAFEISSINLAKQSADLVATGKKAPGRLKIVRAINANHFIEIVNEGYMNLTTVYDANPKSGKFPAVHSRHLGILGQPIFAQYSGLCSQKP